MFCFLLINFFDSVTKFDDNDLVSYSLLQYTQGLLHSIQNADGTVSIIQVDPSNQIITLPDGTTAQVQGIATVSAFEFKTKDMNWWVMFRIFHCQIAESRRWWHRTNSTKHWCKSREYDSRFDRGNTRTRWTNHYHWGRRSRYAELMANSSEFDSIEVLIENCHIFMFLNV